jgi:hypothetical protein
MSDARRLTTAERGYGGSHQAQRDRLAPAVNAGQAWCQEIICLMRDRWIPPGTPWDLAHAPGQDGYLGAAHQRCNRSAGGKQGNRSPKRRSRRVSGSRQW